MMEGLLLFYLILVILVSNIAAPFAKPFYDRDDIHWPVELADILPQWAKVGILYRPLLGIHFLAGVADRVLCEYQLVIIHTSLLELYITT